MDDDLLSPHLSTPSTISSMGASLPRFSPRDAGRTIARSFSDRASGLSIGSVISPFSDEPDLRASFLPFKGEDHPIKPTAPLNEYPLLDFASIQGRVVQMAKDSSQHRHLQQLLDYLSPAEIHELYLEIRPFLYELITDSIGLLFFQQFLEVSPDRYKMDIVCFPSLLHPQIYTLSPSIVSASCTVHGTRSIQSLLSVSVLPVFYVVLH